MTLKLTVPDDFQKPEIWALATVVDYNMMITFHRSEDAAIEALFADMWREGDEEDTPSTPEEKRDYLEQRDGLLWDLEKVEISQ